MFCPKCKVEYREGFFMCADCQVPLVDFLLEDKPDANYCDQCGTKLNG